MKNETPCKYVLLVEDDEDLRNQMANILRDEGYRVETKTNGKFALEYLQACDPSDLPGCIILDLMMPIMTGAEFLNQIVNDHSHDLGKIPVLIVTAAGSSKDNLVGIPPNVGRVQKPMEIDSFLESVMEHCGKPEKFSSCNLKD